MYKKMDNEMEAGGIYGFKELNRFTVLRTVCDFQSIPIVW